ncbi:phosphate ABC transporter substrate-binding protein [Synechocystis sp. LKSZ1]|uniref:phosphate ABC transporter substrate-binding protein n=1 Tax=Synechocystis sp. LKSZ1 TaxID=3144951 RepID=UPI00336BDED4
MAQKNNNEALILILAFALTGGLVGAGIWWFFQQSKTSVSDITPLPSPGKLSPPPSPMAVTALPEPAQVAPGTTVRIDGSTSMVNVNEALKKSFQQAFAGTAVETNAQGSDKGILLLLTGKIDLAASSRPLSPEEQAQGLVAVPITQDQIAIVVGRDNPFQQGLTLNQVQGIFQGKLTNWQQVGGPDATIAVINRPAISGTHQIFKHLALQEQNFGTTPNIQTLERDATTPILRMLGQHGISYATYVQVARQQTARILPIDDRLPGDRAYPLQRELYYIYKSPPSPAVKAFLGYATSPKGQATLTNLE